uniref:Uncharacterized protein n=1 Tax=Arundo donax TaxID=35708 RepID=A0A0A9QEX7_ARUDO
MYLFCSGHQLPSLPHLLAYLYFYLVTSLWRHF